MQHEHKRTYMRALVTYMQRERKRTYMQHEHKRTYMQHEHKRTYVHAT